MQAIISPGIAQGTVKVPPSKSMMQRVCAAALLHTGRTTIHNPGRSNDDHAALNIIQQLGATVQQLSYNTIEITSNGVQPKNNQISCGESGLSARLFTPIAALSDQSITITGDGSLLSRPMDVFSEIFATTGVTIKEFNGHLPITLQGPLQPQNITVDGATSSQFLSGLLFAYAFSATEAVTIKVQNLKSKPYIDLTLEVLKQFGKHISHDQYETFHIDPAAFEHKDEVTVTIEGDWSNAACWIVAGALGGSVSIEGLYLKSVQADRKLLDILSAAGVQFEESNAILRVSVDRLRAFDFNAIDSPDLFPLLSILAALSKGESFITGIHRLWHKESNRIESITEMLHQFGVFYSIEDDDLCIRGVNQFNNATIDSYNDHRIVMAAAIGALRAREPITIVNASAIDKSYPDFFKDLTSLGISCELKNE